jgi:radical SAM superfamily enzyme YgiQ (UPF0313 family)
MNILLIRPYPHKHTINLANFAIVEPLELEYLAAYAQDVDVEADIVDMMLDKRRNIKKLLSSKKYDLVAFTGYMTAINIMYKLAREVKEFDPTIVTVVGGMMAEVNPHLFDNGDFDAIVKIDPMNTFRDILKMIQSSSLDFARLNGVYNREKASYEFVKYRPELLPLRNKTAQYRKNYRYAYLGNCASMRTSYGCPNRCNFCICTQAANGKYWMRKMDDVIAEIKTIDEDLIMITDDNFTANIKRVIEFCDALERENIKKRWFILCTANAIANNPDVFKRFRDNGLTCVFMGIEAFEDNELKELNKKSTAEQNRKALQTLSDLKVDLSGGLICMPDWKKQNFDTLIANLSQFVPITPMVNALIPMLGTPIYEVYKDRFAADERRFEIFDMAHLIVRPEHMSPRQFYLNVLRVYKNTSYSKQMFKYILDNYGKSELKRHKKSSHTIIWQYIELILKNRI